MKILIPTDFSKESLKALIYAKELYGLYGVKYVLIHIPIVRHSGNTVFFNINKEYMDEQIDKMAEFISDLQNEYPKAQISGIVSAGTIVDNLIEKAEEIEAQLIVMATNGNDDVEDNFLGTNSSTLLTYSKIPTLIVPTSMVALSKPKHITFCIDDPKHVDSNAIYPLLQLTKMENAVLNILHVMKDEGEAINFDLLPQQLIDSSAKNIEIKALDIESEILNYVSENNSDMLVVLKHERNFFDRLFKRSLSSDLSMHSAVPLFVLKKTKR